MLFRLIIIIAIAAATVSWLYRLFKRRAARIRSELEDAPVVGNETAEAIAALRKQFSDRLQEERRAIEKRTRELNKLDRKNTK